MKCERLSTRKVVQDLPLLNGFSTGMALKELKPTGNLSDRFLDWVVGFHAATQLTGKRSH
jgi:hypothetical protein